MKLINKKQSIIPELVLDDKVARSDKEKAEPLAECIFHITF